MTYFLLQHLNGQINGMKLFLIILFPVQLVEVLLSVCFDWTFLWQIENCVLQIISYNPNRNNVAITFWNVSVIESITIESFWNTGHSCLVILKRHFYPRHYLIILTRRLLYFFKSFHPRSVDNHPKILAVN